MLDSSLPYVVSQSLTFRVMILLQVLACGSYSILVHLCERNGAIEFSSITMNFILELIKLVFSIGALTCCIPIKHTEMIIPCKRKQAIFWWRQSLPYSIPSLIYLINNNLAVHMQLQMDAASYQILSNFKIITTAVLYRLIIKQKLRKQQWFALILLFFGGLFYSLGIIKEAVLFSSCRYNCYMFLLYLGTLKTFTKMPSPPVILEMYIHPIWHPHDNNLLHIEWPSRCLQ